MSFVTSVGFGTIAGFTAVVVYALVPTPNLGGTVSKLGPAIRTAADPRLPLRTALNESLRRIRLVLTDSLRTLPAAATAAVAFGVIWGGGDTWISLDFWPSGLGGAGLGAVAALAAIRTHPKLPRRWR